jgi:DNA-binding NtrC family response regulator
MSDSKASVLVIDDEEIIREALEALLGAEGYGVTTAATAAEGIEALGRTRVDAVLLDLMLPDRSGLDVLDDIRRFDDDLPVVMITAYGTIESAIAATKQGAFHYFAKPFKNDEVVAVVRNAVERRRLVGENRALRDQLRSDAYRFDEIIGGSGRIRAVYDLIARAAPSRATVLIQGESGTGKELVARAFHRRSARADKPFVTVNSGNLPPDLFESNLFGHVKGAFTGAVYPKKGLFETADKGTIFFDEIGNVPMDTQVKLLRVLQEREFMRLGGVDTIKVDVRVIAATNADLRELTKEGRFREDLFYRLNVILVALPPLRDRKSDIPLIVQHFLDKFSEESRRRALVLTPAAMDRLLAYDWPGNVRELENVIERAVVLSTDREIGVDLIPDHVSANPKAATPDVVIPPGGIHFREVMIGYERKFIEAALEAAGGVQKKAAELLHIRATTLNEMIKRYEMLPRKKKGPEGESDEE